MKRSFADWLLIPLFLLPLAAGGGFAIHARRVYLAEIEHYRKDGAAVAAQWLEDLPPGDLRLSRAFGGEDAGGLPAEQKVRFRLLGREGAVWFGPHALGSGAWVLSSEYPVGLPAKALADPAVRLAIETGKRPLDAATVDDGTDALSALWSAPDPELLRAAPLPAMTKLFLVRQWKERGITGDRFDDAERLLTLLASIQRADAVSGLPELPGEHDVGGVPLIVPGAGEPLVVLPPGPHPGFTFRHQRSGGDDALAVLRLVIPAANDPAHPDMPVAWSGRLDEPVAGEWRICLPAGYDWWRSPYFERTAGPVLGGMLLFLTIPAALFFSLRRRRKLDEARARFITELAHDLRTPLTSLRLHAEMLAEGRAPEDRREQYVEIMARESSRVSGLLANLLDLSRLERGARDLKLERLDLDETLEPAIRDFVMLYPARGDDLTVTGGDGLSVRADRTALSRCLLNLLDNAGKFTSAGVAIRIGWSANGADRVVIRVEDDGPGVPAGERGKLFRRYERGERAKRDGVPGTGLGLSLVAELCAQMGGSARFAPGGKGAAFELLLPRGAA
jgi:signal transduction histidine kinase